MAEKFFLDPDGLALATSQLKSAGDNLDAAYKKLAAVLDDHHGCWSDDDIGKAFGQGSGGNPGYVKNEADMRQGAEGAGQGPLYTRKGLDDSSRNFQNLDEDSAAAIDAAFVPEA